MTPKAPQNYQYKVIRLNGTPSRYTVSEDGQIYSRISDRVLKPYIQKLNKNGRKLDGYFYVSLQHNSKTHKIAVHRLVAIAFKRNPKRKKYVNHKDFDIYNNNKSNLEWVTNQENMIHASENGRLVRSNLTNSRVKLSLEDVVEIRKQFRPGKNNKALRDKFGISKSHCRAVSLNVYWKNI